MPLLSKPLVEEKESSVIPEENLQSGKDTGHAVAAAFSDEELLEKFRNEDTRHYAFNLLVREYQKRLYWHIRRLVLDHDDANDIIQNVFIRVWNNLGNFRGESKLYTWLYTIATNESLTFLRKKKRRALISFRSVEHEMAEKLASDPLFSGDKIQLLLQKAILKLPPQQRLVFNMKYYDGMKYEEISAILGVTTGALKANYHHAVKKISKYVTIG